MSRGIVAGMVMALLSSLLLHCGGRESSGGAGRDAGGGAADATVTTVVGNACSTAADCPGMSCLTTFMRSCMGPGQPHTWSTEFPGGYCGPAPDPTTWRPVTGCPAGTMQWSIYVRCDGIPFRFCARVCASDRDCRTSEGYRCHPEVGVCAPPAFQAPVEDGGV